MSKSKSGNIIRRIVDTAMTVLLLFLMAYQVTGEAAHEWLGMAMTALVIVHQILNRKWYGSLFKGRYNPYRTVTTLLNVLLLISFLLTAFSGMSTTTTTTTIVTTMTSNILTTKTTSFTDGTAGDADEDGEFTISDLVTVAKAIAGVEGCALSAAGSRNVDCDGITGVDNGDLKIMLQVMANLRNF